jgi:protein subunit release factor A
MGKSKSIRVTANVKKSLEILKNAQKEMREGDLKEEAKAAIKYLERTFKGVKQPLRGVVCPKDTPIIRG